jgi:hypothetical protein
MDDLYPNDGSFMGGVPLEPLDQAIERRKERAQAMEASNVIKDMLQRLDERIDFYQRHSNIPDEIRTDPQAFLIISNSYTATADALISEKEWIEGILEASKRK